VRYLTCALAILLFCGCELSSLRVEPSKYELTEEMREYADSLRADDDVFEFQPIPYVSEGRATNRCAAGLECFLLYFEMERFGKLDDGYVYQDADFLCPLLFGMDQHLFDAEGKRKGSLYLGSIGVYVFYPFLNLLSLHSSRSTDAIKKESYTDYGLSVITLPGVNTSLLKISSYEVELLFIPLWTKDRSPRG